MIKESKKNTACSVIVLNYFGEKVIGQTINSLLKLDYSKEKLEIIIVDNNSTDQSRLIIDSFVKKYPKLVKRIYLDSNTGFAKGNNHGIKKSKGKYVALLNNDCVVDKDWLKELVKKAESDKKIFSVASKILLYPKYTDIYLPAINGLWLQNVVLKKSKIVKFSSQSKESIPFSFLIENYLIELPLDFKHDSEIELVLYFWNSNKLSTNDIRDKYSNTIRVKKVSNLNKNKISVHCILKKSQMNKFYEKVQNAGSIVFQDGYGRDIGAVVKYQKQNYEKDLGQFDTDKEVYSSCGAAVLYNKKVLNEIGLLDETFFMYYEDTEISERARIRGYKNYYCHKAIARHLHALSSKEWSPFFLFNVERGRLLHVYYTFPKNIFIKEFIKYIFKSIIKLLKNIKNGQKVTNSIQNFKVIIDIIINLQKYQKIRISKEYNSDKVNENYKNIINGYWLLN